MRVLGIETSCDDTGVAVYDSVAGVLANRLATQVAVHLPYGGVVPELAARDHIRTLLPLIDHVLSEAFASAPAAKPDAIAYTAGPGLAGALLVGAAVGKSLAQSWGVPAVGVHHMEGHLLATMLAERAPDFPLLALLVSGGHTMLVQAEAVGDYRILGQSVDDAAGEAFDKTAKLLGLGPARAAMPGGEVGDGAGGAGSGESGDSANLANAADLADLSGGFSGGAAIACAARHGRAERFVLPRPMTNRAGLDFSFSGLKTQVRVVAGQTRLDRQAIADIALAFETAVVETLVIKCQRALRQTGRRRLVVSGGVGANARLRLRLRQAAAALGAEVFYPPPELCTDNGAMIAYAGYRRLMMAAQAESGGHSSGNCADKSIDNGAFDIRPRWSIEDI